GFIASSGAFLLLWHFLSDAQFLAWGWRLPFIASSLLVLVGLYVRLRITETPAFRRVLDNNERLRLPLVELFRAHGGRLVLGTLAAVATFVVFYLMTVFTLTWGTGHGWSRQAFVQLQMGGVVFFGLAIPLSAWLADRFDPRTVLIAAAAALA